jgi:hypothetical protein
MKRGENGDTAMKHRRDLIERLREFNKLSETEKVEARIAWLEWKMVEVLWFLVGVTSMLAGGAIAWIISDTVGSRSLWLLVPVFLLGWLAGGWWVQRRTFRAVPESC